jgi:hypothetical protein
MLFKTPKAELRNGLLELRDNVHPKPLTDSRLETLASSGSCHRAKAAAFHRTKGSFRRTSWAHISRDDLPLRSTTITAASSL